MLGLFDQNKYTLTLNSIFYDFKIELSMPLFNDLSSPGDDGYLRIKVNFSNSVEDILILSQIPGTSIYEGHLQDDYEVPVLLIDTPLTNKRLVRIDYLI